MGTHFCDWPSWLCISASSFLGVQNIGREILESSVQIYLLTFPKHNLLQSEAILNSKTRMSFLFFGPEMVPIIAALRSHLTGVRVRARRERRFSTRANLFGTSDKDVIKNISFTKFAQWTQRWPRTSNLKESQDTSDNQTSSFCQQILFNILRVLSHKLQLVPTGKYGRAARTEGWQCWLWTLQFNCRILNLSFQDHGKCK